MRILIIVPAFNEEDNIINTIHNIRSVGNFDILVVNDSSRDGTLHKAKSQQNIKVADLPVNLGIGGSVQTGYMYAAARGYDIAIQVDGDGQHDPGFIQSIIRPIIEEGCDIVIGSRFINKAGYQSTKLRRVGISFLQHLIRSITGMPITDPTSGFRAFGTRAIRYFAKHYPNDYPEPESLVIAHRAGMRILEVPVVMKAREGGTSSIYAHKTIYFMIKVTLSIMMARYGRIAKDA